MPWNERKPWLLKVVFSNISSSIYHTCYADHFNIEFNSLLITFSLTTKHLGLIHKKWIQFWNWILSVDDSKKGIYLMSDSHKLSEVLCILHFQFCNTAIENKRRIRPSPSMICRRWLSYMAPICPKNQVMSHPCSSFGGKSDFRTLRLVSISNRGFKIASV